MSAFLERLRGAIPVPSSVLDSDPSLLWLSFGVYESSSVTLMLKEMSCSESHFFHLHVHSCQQLLVLLRKRAFESADKFHFAEGRNLNVHS